MCVALWEVFLEGFCVALAVGVVTVGVLAVGVVVVVPVPAVVVVVVVGVVLAGVVAAVSVLFWVCEFGVVSQGWGGEVVEGWSGCGVDGALWGAGWCVVGWVDEDGGEEDGVEEFLEAGRGVRVGVEAVAVFEEGEGFVEAVFEVFAVGGQGGEFPAYLIEFASEAGLLGFEQVEGDGVGVVGFEELGLLGFEFAGLGGEFFGCGCVGGRRGGRVRGEGISRWCAARRG